MWLISGLCFATLIAGIQDWRARQVSNALSIPMLFFGLLFLAWRFFVEPISALFSLAVIAFLTLAAERRWMGGADWKVLVGLWGAWPLGGLAALFFGGVFGLVCLLRGENRHTVSIPAVTAFAVGTSLTYLALAIYTLVR
jgi:Flp pilus assembly protein protease CpaA